VNTAPEKRPRGDHNRAGGKPSPFERFNTMNAHCGLIENETGDSTLDAKKRCLLLEEGANRTTVHAAVALRPWRPDRSALSAIQHAELERRHISGARHYPTQSVHLTDYRAFGYSADSGIARHLPDALERAGDETDPSSEPSGRHSSFGPCVATSDDDHVEVIFSRSRGVLRHVEKLPSLSEYPHGARDPIRTIDVDHQA
jgi:hypothetical protein